MGVELFMSETFSECRGSKSSEFQQKYFSGKISLCTLLGNGMIKPEGTYNSTFGFPPNQFVG